MSARGGSGDYDPTTTGGVTNGGVSFWWQQIGLPRPGPELDHDLTCDVAIVGGGLTGLWTAYYLAQAAPHLDVVILEAEFAGYGASGRNGGWLSSEMAGNPAPYARGPQGQAGVRRLEAALRGTVDEVLGVLEREGIEADQLRSGVLYAARSAPQLDRMRAAVDAEHDRVLDADALRDRLVIDGALGARFDPDCARVHPARLVRGLARVVRALGVRIHESTRVTAIEPGRVRTRRATVSAPVVLRCIEGYTAGLPGLRRAWLPMNSAMVVTEPLSESQWERIGWSGAELLGDEAHAYCYAQRTADGRIALGGRGIPYRFGSRTDEHGRTQEWTIESLRETVTRLFPSLKDVRLDHAWCGVLGVPRDWCASVDLDPGTGLGRAGGYVGSGLSATNLAGRTLRDLTLRHLGGDVDDDLVTLPWTGRGVRRWEPEPLRWAGVHALYRVYRAADRREDAGLSRTSRMALLADRISGRH
ncbi:FAD-binding oxidoreductase [Alteromonas gracilis]